jgi:hypothetical protein
MNENPLQQLQRHQRRRRWIVRLTLLFVVLLIGLVLIASVMFRSSALSIAEAKALVMKLGECATREEMEQLLGKPAHVVEQNKQCKLTWIFTHQQLLSIDGLSITVDYEQVNALEIKSIGTGEGRLFGWSVWEYRWNELQTKLGLK